MATQLKTAHMRRRTFMPDVEPPQLHCPECAARLAYRNSYIGGVNAAQSEQWDYFQCTCGVFEYRHRTKRLKKLDERNDPRAY